MFKRVRWMGVGAVAGVGASVWAQIRLRRTLGDHPSIETGARAASRLRSLTVDVRDAVVEGRHAMAEREDALRDQLAGRQPGGRPARSGPDGHPSGPPERRLRVVETTAAPVTRRSGRPGDADGGRPRRPG